MPWMRRLTALLLLAGLAVAPALAWRSRCAPSPARAAAAAAAGESRAHDVNDRPGFGVELEVMHLHIELAWFESVPFSPGRRLVFSLLAAPSPGE
jgi:hypothetical protein